VAIFYILNRETIDFMPIQDNRTPEGTGDHGPTGKGNYTVGEGQCVESIAAAHGFFWETIWNLTENAGLKQTRKDPNTLLPGDRIFIPEKREKAEPIATEKRHRFKRKGVPSFLSIYVLQFGEPVANRRYIANIDGELRNGTTDDKGLVKEPVLPGARRCTLTVGEGDDELILELTIGGLDPVSEISGVQKRLDNLGYKCRVTGKMDDQTGAAIKTFQKDHNLEMTGNPDNASRQALLDHHKG
jgi:N-acetylmuramoyl-L-alanine amidase